MYSPPLVTWDMTTWLEIGTPLFTIHPERRCHKRRVWYFVPYTMMSAVKSTSNSVPKSPQFGADFLLWISLQIFAECCSKFRQHILQHMNMPTKSCKKAFGGKKADQFYNPEIPF